MAMHRADDRRVTRRTSAVRASRAQRGRDLSAVASGEKVEAFEGAFREQPVPTLCDVRDPVVRRANRKLAGTGDSAPGDIATAAATAYTFSAPGWW